MRILIIGDNPYFLGGISVFQKNVSRLLKKENSLEIAYRSDKEESNLKEGIVCRGFKLPKIFIVKDIIFNSKIKKWLDHKFFDIINSHAIWGYWIHSYKKRGGQRIVHTYHGSSYNFYKNGLKKYGLVKKIIFSPLLLFSYFVERPPWKKADAIICVSNHVKKEFEKFYGKRKNVFVLRTGVNLKMFKRRSKIASMKKIGLNPKKKYGLYVGRGGYWTKGLDKIVNLAEEIFKRDSSFRLLVVGADEKKVKKFINKEFVIFIPVVSRDKIPFYYNSADIFFSMSRYEGGAPSMVTSEAIASGCLVVTDKEARQEIITDKKNGIIVGEDYKSESERIIRVLRDKKRLNKILAESLKLAKTLSIKKWGVRYLEILGRANK